MIVKNSEYLPYLGMLKTISITAIVLTIIFFMNWLTSESVLYAILCLCSLTCFVIFFYPVLLEQKVRIENSNIVFLYRILPPLTAPISDSLYQIVTKNGEIVSFRFKVGRRRTQLSPLAYKDGDKLLTHLKVILQGERIITKLIEK